MNLLNENRENLVDILSLSKRGVTAFVGAGGKTETMNVLTREFGLADTIYTTTTAIQLPQKFPWMLELVDGPCQLQRVLQGYEDKNYAGFKSYGLEGSRPVLVIGRKLSAPVPGGARKLLGIKPKWLDQALPENFSIPILVEADGAARHSVKAPAEHEPALPEKLSTLVIIQGAPALGRKASSPHCFRSEKIKDRTSLPGSRLYASLSLYCRLFAGRPGYGKHLCSGDKAQLVLARAIPARREFCRRLGFELESLAGEKFADFTALSYRRGLKVIYQHSLHG